MASEVFSAREGNINPINAVGNANRSNNNKVLQDVSKFINDSKAALKAPDEDFAGKAILKGGTEKIKSNADYHRKEIKKEIKEALAFKVAAKKFKVGDEVDFKVSKNQKGYRKGVVEGYRFSVNGDMADKTIRIRTGEGRGYTQDIKDFSSQMLRKPRKQTRSL